jgi:ubiquinone/menaquinone biosynthesis C-methylase UbiE
LKKDLERRFTGGVAQQYDRLMVPLFFRPYAEELTRRANELRPRRILETAAGTGVLTEALANTISSAEIIATDLNQPMLDVAADRVGTNVQFVQADAEHLPFDSETFDLVVCQFGAMFFANKVRGHQEARRVLAGGGHYLLAIWDALERNAITRAAQQALINAIPEDPPMFMRDGPFGYHDPVDIRCDLEEAGFGRIMIETVELRSRSPSAKDAGEALFYGSPMGVEVEERRPEDVERIAQMVCDALRPFEGRNGLDAAMSAHIVIASA